jgi:hypothetical protein
LFLSTKNNPILDAITKWKPEPRSIFHAKSNCFEKDALMYDQMALKASENDEASDFKANKTNLKTLF